MPSSFSESLTFVSGRVDICCYIDTICNIETSSFDPPWTKEEFIAEIDSGDSRFVILLENGLLIGYLFAKAVLDEVDINKICIRSDYRGRGYGELLLVNFLSGLKGCYSRIFLEVKSTNIPAIRLYEKNGFHANRIRKAIYSDETDALEMVRNLT